MDIANVAIVACRVQVQLILASWSVKVVQYDAEDPNMVLFKCSFDLGQAFGSSMRQCCMYNALFDVTAVTSLVSRFS